MKIFQCKLVRAILLVAAVSSLGTAYAWCGDDWTIVQSGTLLAEPGKPGQSQVSVIVHDGRIDSIRQGFVDASGLANVEPRYVQIIDLRDKVVMPGLIDCHVHLSVEVDRDFKINAVLRTQADAAVDTVVFAKRDLLAGFTTVRDLGVNQEAVFAVRDAINAGKIAGPWVLSSGSALSTTGGHADPSNGFIASIATLAGFRGGVCNGADDCREHVREQVKRGANVIKMMETGGVFDDSQAGTDQQFTNEEARAIVETAHQLGRKVAAHAHGVNGIKAAALAGVDSVEHATMIDAEGIKLMKQHDVYLVPTLLAVQTAAQQVQIPGFMPEAMRQKAIELISSRPVGQQVEMASKAGVKIAFGTDTAVSAHGQNAREFALLVKAGLSAMEALETATVNAADLLGVAREVGSIAPGKRADLIALDKSPLDDIREMTRVSFVMHAGKIYKLNGTPTVNINP
jgi:imidazolonepropionase-like amidohydrolase